MRQCKLLVYLTIMHRFSVTIKNKQPGPCSYGFLVPLATCCRWLQHSLSSTAPILAIGHFNLHHLVPSAHTVPPLKCDAHPVGNLIMRQWKNHAWVCTGDRQGSTGGSKSMHWRPFMQHWRIYGYSLEAEYSNANNAQKCVSTNTRPSSGLLGVNQVVLSFCNNCCADYKCTKAFRECQASYVCSDWFSGRQWECMHNKLWMEYHVHILRQTKAHTKADQGTH